MLALTVILGVLVGVGLWFLIVCGCAALDSWMNKKGWGE